MTDDKDWTWVLDRTCPACGFDTRAVSGPELAPLVRANAAQWPPRLAAPSARTRPAPGWWSALEYGCHVRDVYRIGDGRIARMLGEDDPLFANWDQDRTAIDDDYAAQDPTVVAAEIGEAAELVARRLEQVRDGAWNRTGRRSDGASFTVESFGRYLLHDPVHHIHDVDHGPSGD